MTDTLYWFLIFSAALISFILWVLMFSAIRRTATAAEAAARSTSELVGLVHGMREEARKASAPKVEKPAYDRTKIPADRFYKDKNKLVARMQVEGLINSTQADQAKAELVERGGHICDHLLALGYLDEASLRAFLEAEAKG